MAKFNDRLKLLRHEAGLSQQDFAKQLGISKSSINMYERGEREPGLETLEAIADSFNVDMDYLLGKSEHRNKSAWLKGLDLLSPDITEDVVTFPVLMDVAAGYDQPAQVLQNWEGEKIDVPRAFLHGRPKEDYFAMRVIGHSMYPDYQEGDVLLVLRQDTLDRSGQVGLVLYAGEDATLKKVEYVEGEDWMKLLPVNPQYPPRTITGVDLEQCRILGVPKILVRNIK